MDFIETYINNWFVKHCNQMQVIKLLLDSQRTNLDLNSKSKSENISENNRFKLKKNNISKDNLANNKSLHDILSDKQLSNKIKKNDSLKSINHTRDLRSPKTYVTKYYPNGGDLNSPEDYQFMEDEEKPFL